MTVDRVCAVACTMFFITALYKALVQFKDDAGYKYKPLEYIHVVRREIVLLA